MKLFLPVLLIVATGVAGAAPQSAPRPVAADSTPLGVAMVSAVLERIGPKADVRIEALTPAGWSQPFTRIAIDPSARIGAPVWFTVFTGPAASVRVRAELKISLDYAVATQPIARGQAIAAGDLTGVRGSVTAVPFRRLPTAAELVGARALRPIAPGETIQPGFVSPVPAVQAGQPVTAMVHIGTVEVSATFTAADSGALNDIIRIVNPETHRTLRARVVSAGIVEVVNVR